MPLAIDTGTPERAQHGQVVIEGHDGKALDEDGRRVIRARVAAECPLDMLPLAPSQYDAGLWLRTLYHKAGVLPREAMRYDVFGRDRGEMTDAQAWNQRCLRETLRDMGEYAPILARVCGHDEMPASSELRRLQTALNRLARHRGIA